MRGTVLLLDGRDSRSLYAEHLRQDGLIVYEAEDPEVALQLIDRIAPDVVVYYADQKDGPSVIGALRSRVDDATSIIVAAGLSDGEQTYDAGADSLLLQHASPNEILNEVRRAVILHRSGRRLPRNQPGRTPVQRGWWTRSRPPSTG
jgi:DNA-binding response OmpR family regulator